MKKRKNILAIEYDREKKRIRCDKWKRVGKSRAFERSFGVVRMVVLVFLASTAFDFLWFWCARFILDSIFDAIEKNMLALLGVRCTYVPSLCIAAQRHQIFQHYMHFKANEWRTFFQPIARDKKSGKNQKVARCCLSYRRQIRITS